MTKTDLKLYELLGDKTLSFGCLFQMRFPDALNPDLIEPYLDSDERNYTYPSKTLHGGLLKTISDTEVRQSKLIKIIGHEPTIADLHRMFASLKIRFEQDNNYIRIDEFLPTTIGYDCTRSLLSQSEETKLAIINLIKANVKI